MLWLFSSVVIRNEILQMLNKHFLRTSIYYKQEETFRFCAIETFYSDLNTCVVSLLWYKRSWVYYIYLYCRCIQVFYY